MPRSTTTRVEVLTFDCYGTLIDWEAGIAAGLGAVTRAHGVDVPDEEMLTTLRRARGGLEAGPYLRYREVLARACRGVCADLGIEPTDDEVDAFAGSVGEWPAFPDSAAALAAWRRASGSASSRTATTTCSRRRTAASASTFDWIVTAQQAGSYKPNQRNFELAFERIGRPRDRILHVAQSLFHDHVPAKELGLRSVWINRRAGREGSGATPPAEARPDATFPDMASFAEDALRS